MANQGLSSILHLIYSVRDWFTRVQGFGGVLPAAGRLRVGAWRFVEVLAFAVVGMAEDDASARPFLDRFLADAEARGSLVEGEHAGFAETAVAIF